MPNARARLDPTTSIPIAPTTARMIWVWITGALRGGVPRRRGRTASAAASSAATGSRSTACRNSASCVSLGGVSVDVSVRGADCGWARSACCAAAVRLESRLHSRTIVAIVVARIIASQELSKTSARWASPTLRCLSTARRGAQLANRALVSSARVPLSTYRLQFNRHFTFVDARAIVDYLNALGVTDAYASSYLKAV